MSDSSGGSGTGDSGSGEAGTVGAGPADPGVPMVECHNCGRLVPAGAYCGNCGAHLPEPEAGRSRMHAYAAAPHEHVLQPSIVSTLFPHLPSRNAHGFRVALGLGAAVVGVLAATGLVAPATIAASLLLPVIYLLYLYDVEVYEREPVLVMLLTFGLGAVLGGAYAAALNHIVRPSVHGTQQSVWLIGVLVPVVAQVLMALPPLLMLGRKNMDDTLDGLTFGVSTALGFTMASVIVGQWSILTAPLVRGIPTDDVLRLLQAGVLAALVNASTTGLIMAGIWAHRRRRTLGVKAARWRGFGGSVAVAFAVQIALGVAAFYVRNQLGLVLLWAVAAGLLLVWLRVVIHEALLDEGRDQPIAPPSPCPECHRLVPTMAFCPACGAARAASPKRGRVPRPLGTAEATA
jgi:RNA polymerase subunit RPABC4/transcription elongation factor Spt4